MFGVFTRNPDKGEMATRFDRVPIILSLVVR